MFYAYTEEYKHNDLFSKDTTNLYNMYKMKVYKTSKCLWPVYIDIFVVKWMGFFSTYSFDGHFPRIHRSVLGKIADLLHF